MEAFTHRIVRRLRGEEAGFSLMEVLFAVSLLAVILGAALSLSQTSGEVAKKDIERAHAIEEVQNGLARMDRELRTATQISSPAPGVSANSVEFQANVRQSDGSRVVKTVRYDCGVPSPTKPTTRRACFRYVDGAATLVIDGVVNGTTAQPVFTANSASPPTYLSILVRRDASGTLKEGYDYAIRLEHGVHLRNVNGSL